MLFRLHGLWQLSNDFPVVYTDYTVIYNASWEDHLRHLTMVVQALREARLTAKPSK